MEKISERTCVICKAKKRKDELFRFLVDSYKNSGQVSFDKEQKQPGRGFYICSAKCWDSAIAKKRKIRVGSDAKKAKSVSLPEKTFEEITRV